MLRITFKRIAAVAVTAAAVTMLLAGSAGAQGSSGTFGATVTPEVTDIVITGGSEAANDGSLVFGSQALGGTPDTTGSTLEDGSVTCNGSDCTVIVTNNGSIAVATLKINYDVAAGAEAECGTTDWAADATAPPSAGSDIFGMRVDDDGEFTTGETVIPTGTTLSSDILAGATIAASAAANIDFELTMPSAATSGNNECTIAMTLTATG